MVECNHHPNSHAATAYNGWTYGYDANGNMTTRTNGGQTYTLGYDAENRLTSVSGAATASFTYDGDGRQVLATVGGVTTVYVGSYYEWTSAGNTKYYFAGGQRVAMRRTGYAADNGLSWLFADHLGSTSLRVGATGGSPLSELRFKAWGETRYTSGSKLTKDQFTGQRSEMEQIGLYFYNARWYDPALGRFAQADTVVPLESQGVQAWDRYAYVNNNPVKYTDPTGNDVGCAGRNASECEPPENPKPPVPPLLPPGPPYRATHTPKNPVIPLLFKPLLVPTTTPRTQLAPYYQGKTGNHSTDPGKYLYTVLANGVGKTIHLGTNEGGDLPTRWTIEYQASYEKEVYERGLSLTVVEQYKTYANNLQASGNFATNLITLEPITMNFLGEIVDGSRSSGPFWIENGDINTWVIVQIGLYGNEQVSKSYDYWFTK